MTGLIEVEGRDLAEIESLVAVQADQLLIELQRRPPGGEAEDAIGFLAHEPGDDPRPEHAPRFGVVLDDDFHGRRGLE